MQRVIVNSTPLIVLGNIEMLWVLKQLYEEVVIPKAVFDEVTCKSDMAGKELEKADWIKVECIEDVSDKKMYRAKLHEGEVEVMILAQQAPKADFVIIDDNAAREYDVILDTYVERWPVELFFCQSKGSWLLINTR